MAFSTATRLGLPFLQDERVRKQVIKSIGILAGLGAGIASYAYFHEPLNVRFDRLSIELPNARGRLPASGLRILHLSDTHFRGAQWREQSKIDSIRRACRNLEYDLLVHTGDFLHYDSGLSNVLSLLDSLPRPRLASYAVLGNHDYMTYGHKKMLSRSWAKFTDFENHTQYQLRQNRQHSPLQLATRLVRFGHFFMNSSLDLKRTGPNNVARLEAALAQRNIQTLHNRAVRLTHQPDPVDNIDLYIAGVDDVTEGLPDVSRAMNGIPYDAPTLLLSHNPDILLEPGIEQADLILAGHTHGGQVVLPWLGAANTNSDYLPRHEVAGYLQRGKTQVYISRGIGEGIPIRLGASPQIALISVKPA